MDLYFSDVSRLLTDSALSEWKGVAFSAYCCERMLPNFSHFANETGFGDALILREALDAIWHWIESGGDVHDREAMIDACDAQAPDTSSFSSLYTSAALDATAAIAVTMESIGGMTVERLIEVASLSRDTVDLFVQGSIDLDPMADGFEKEILGSHLMQTELRTQFDSVLELKELEGRREDVVSELMAKWSRLRSGSLP